MTPEAYGLLAQLIMKLMILFGLLIYIIFALVIVRQEILMSKVLEASSVRILGFLTWLHLAAAVVVFFFALILL